jgi:hypothetical protein
VLENPDLFVAIVYLGMMDTGISRSSGASHKQLPVDESDW